MRARWKTVAFKGLNVLGDRLGFAAYHALQRWGSRRLEVDQLVVRQRRTLEELDQVLARLGRSFFGATVMEIGSGWTPATPYLLKYERECAAVHTYDLRRHYSRRRVALLNSHFFSGRPASERPSFAGPYNLAAGVHYHPRTDLARGGRLAERPDYALSRFVLEHVPPREILEIHKTLRLHMSSEGLVLHHVSPSDHRAYSDPSLSLYDFLRFSDAQWNGVQTRFDYHNRLRLPDYRRLFDQAGFDVVFERYDSAATSDKLKRDYERVPVHEQFQGYSEVENSACKLVFALAPRREG